MAFLLRTHQPQRRRPRDRPHQRGSRTTLLTVGRDPDCDIRLNDLAVALHHATIELVGEGQLGVSAEMGMTIEIDGSAVGFGQIDLHSGGDIRVGPFLLRVLPTPSSAARTSRSTSSAPRTMPRPRRSTSAASRSPR